MLRTGWRFLKRLKTKAICRLIGHDYDLCDCYADHCWRCGLEFDWEFPPRSDVGFWLTLMNWRAYAAFRQFRSWLKCPVCDGRAGKHNDDCIPF